MGARPGDAAQRQQDRRRADERHRQRQQHPHGDAAAEAWTEAPKRKPSCGIGLAEELADDARERVAEDEDAAEEARPAKAEPPHREPEQDEKEEPSAKAS